MQNIYTVHGNYIVLMEKLKTSNPSTPNMVTSKPSTPNMVTSKPSTPNMVNRHKSTIPLLKERINNCEQKNLQKF